MKTGIQLIIKERKRQIWKEGFTAEHDAGHHSGELNDAALAYAFAAAEQTRGKNLEYVQTLAESGNLPRPWPWESSWWKPSADPIRNLVKAGALIAAEIDSLQRIATKQREEGV